MREIKFRVWDKEEEEFAGDYDTGEHSRIEICNGEVTVFRLDLVDALVNGEHEQYEEQRVLKDNIEVMQYTGRQDSKGVDMYEGDIVECMMSFKGGSLPHLGEIVYMDSFGAFATKNQSGETLLHNHMLNTFKVVGNIHENPDLV